MKQNQKGFSHIAIIAIIVTLCAVGGAGYYVYNKNHKDDKKAAIKTSATTQSTGSDKSATESKVADSYAGWQEITLMPEGLKLKVPASVNAPSLISLKTDGVATVTDIGNGFSLYTALLGDPKVDNSYGNTEQSAAYDKFTTASQQYYITNSTISLDISTCETQVCALPSKTNAGKSVLVQVNYHAPNTASRRAPEAIPMSDPYIPTVLQILKSVSY